MVREQCKQRVEPERASHPNARPARFSDPRLRGRDNKPYGPLPREWTHYNGTYYHSNKVVIAYTVGEAHVLELPGYERSGEAIAFSRTLNIDKSARDLWMRLAPEGTPVALVGKTEAKTTVIDGFNVLHIPAAATPLNLKVLLANSGQGMDGSTLFAFAAYSTWRDTSPPKSARRA